MRVLASQPMMALCTALTVSAALISGCSQAGVMRPADGETARIEVGGPTLAADNQKLTITGVRLTKGNAVDCPQVRTDDGRIIPVSYLAPTIGIGDRVDLTGYMAVTTSCRGRVLFVEEAR